MALGTYRLRKALMHRIGPRSGWLARVLDRSHFHTCDNRRPVSRAASIVERTAGQLGACMSLAERDSLAFKGWHHEYRPPLPAHPSTRLNDIQVPS